jgi:predicted dehydrogenase
MGDRSSISRRVLLGSAARLAGGAAAAPWIVSASAAGAAGTTAPSNRITLGLIGCGEHGVGWNLPQIFRNADSQVIAVCDVDEPRRERARKVVDEHYAAALGQEGYRGCAVYEDFRELIRRKDIDAVAVCTPDHWHVIPAIMAARAGKDVICEKPLTLTLAEGQLLCRTVERTRRIFQTASENRSIDTYIRMCELVRNGRIGTLRHIRVSLPGGNETRGQNFNDREVQAVPRGFNYDLWLGQAPVAPYCPARCHGSFRWNLDYSGGRLTDWGAHMIDLAQWGNGTEDTGPVEVVGTGRFPPRSALFNTAEQFDLDYRYASGVTMKVTSGGAGIRFEGSEGWIGFEGWRGPLQAGNPAILDSKIGPAEVHLYRPSEIVSRTEGAKGGEHRNFIDCVKSRKPCYAPAAVGHRTISIAHIGNIAMMLGRRLQWDPQAERFKNDDEANAMLSRRQREPWTIDNIETWLKGNA